MRRRTILQQKAAIVLPGNTVLCPRCKKPFKARGLGKHMASCKE